MICPSHTSLPPLNTGINILRNHICVQISAQLCFFELALSPQALVFMYKMRFGPNIYIYIYIYMCFLKTSFFKLATLPLVPFFFYKMSFGAQYQFLLMECVFGPKTKWSSMYGRVSRPPPPLPLLTVVLFFLFSHTLEPER